MKIHLLKKLLCLSPVVISPILVTACGSSNKDYSKITTSGKFYLDFYQRELNAIWATKAADVAAAAVNISANHQYNLQINVLSEVLNKAKTDGAGEFKKAFPQLDNYNASIFDDINVSFSIPDDSKGNLKVGSDGVLSVYPINIINGATSEKQIDYTLKLNASRASSKDLSGSLSFNLQSKIINYDTSSGLSNDNIYAVYGSNDMSTILAATFGNGLDVGARQVKGGYNFVNYSSSNGLISNNINSVYGNPNLSTILVGENLGGLDVGTKQADGGYAFVNYDTDKGLATNTVLSVYGNADLSTILVGTSGGINVGTSAGGSYTFTSYNTSKGLVDNVVNGICGSADLSTILVGTGGGLSVGTRASASDPYTFKNYNTTSGPSSQHLANDNVWVAYGNADMSTILVGEDGGGLDVGTRASASDPYTFTNYNASNGLKGNDVLGLSGSYDLFTILVGEYGGGLDVGTKQNDGSYTFTNYKTGKGLANNNVQTVYGNTDMSAILVGENGGGMDISSNLWFA